MNVFHKGQGAFIKIFSLAIGLTVGLVLIAKVQLERNYNRCIVDKEHVFEVSEYFKSQGSDANEFNKTPGGAIPALCRYIPEIVVGTRYTYQFTNEKLTLENGQRYSFEHALFVDSCFFDIFSTKTLQGDAKKTLSTAGQCLISQRLNEKLGGNAVGQTFCYMAAPNKPMTIGGVFENYDENSTFSQLDIVMSMPSIGSYSYDGTANLMGNDRYDSFVRLRPDTDMKKVEAEMNTMLKEQIPWDRVREAGIEDFGFRFNPVVGNRMKNQKVKTTCVILSVVAFVMLFTAVMNYILVVISLLVGKARLVAIRKVLGAPKREFYLSTLKEATVHFVVALLVMALLLMAGQDLIRQLLGLSVRTLFSVQTAGVLTAVCLLILFFCGFLPGYIHSRIPTVYAYRLFSENKRLWKLSLLAFQFMLSTMLLCILSTVYRQYGYMLGKDMGYDYHDVAYIETVNPSDSTYTLAREIEKLPCVAHTSTAFSLFLEKQSGNNVMIPGNPRQLFNFACMYWFEPSIVQTMGLTMVEGGGLSRLDRPGWKPEVLIDEHFAQLLKQHTGWTDVVDRTIMCTEFDNMPLTIKGIVKNFESGTLVNYEERPVMMINGNIYAYYIMLRFHELNAENIMAVQQVCNRLYPDADLIVKPYASELTGRYIETQHTRDLIVIGCLGSLLITLVGLIGYVRDEVQRRSRELAIRKVMGATMSELQSLFLHSVAVISIPSIVVGIALGWCFSSLLLEQFAEKIPLSWHVFLADALLVILVIAAVVLLQTRRVVSSNPVKYLKTE